MNEKNENRAGEAFSGGGYGVPTHFLKEHKGMDSRAFSEILRGFQRDIRGRNFRNLAFQEISRQYNISLRTAWFEASVIFLMLLRMIFLHEKKHLDAGKAAKIARDIIDRTMVLKE